MKINFIQAQLELQILGITPSITSLEAQTLAIASDISDLEAEDIDIASDISSLQDPSTATLTSSTSVALDFDPLLPPVKLLTATHNITFTTANLQTGRSVIVKILASGSDRNLTFPAWVFIGAAAPASLASGKTAVLSLLSTTSADAGVIAAYSAEV